ncbi:hypothetical protein HMPREF9004_1136 [Schaalia cardiffensis F0333]|uniref:Uncharacterized protein n=1 Tax=Schaalia cardiffensis F0333 TaxID=888050 RepID=N6W6F3_9ACTO|nr:hypothetical protein HMPREF9004_1136 [Schaalia cardiffensis F0333]
MRGCEGPAHPRSRGEHISACGEIVTEIGSSPLTRGAHPHEVERAAPCGLIPAHAGSTS